MALSVEMVEQGKRNLTDKNKFRIPKQIQGRQ